MRIAPSLAALIATLPLPLAAHAADAPKPRADTGFALSRDATSSAPYARAKALAAQGKLEAALNEFDEAVRHSISPVIRRDRGLVHERLDHTFPAIDDFRAYLAGTPDAADADSIRERLAALEAKVPAEQKRVGLSGDYHSELRGGISYDAERKAESIEREEQLGGKIVAASEETQKESGGKPLREVEEVERQAIAKVTAPTRGGTGPAVGFYAMGRYWSRTGFAGGQAYGATIRYAFSDVSSVISEVGFVNIMSSGGASQMSGFGAMLGYEARFALDNFAANQILLGAGLGYENVKQGSTSLAFSSFLPRGRAGYRHVFATSVALDFTADAGLAVTTAVNAPTDARGTKASLVVGGALALVVGF